ncbi:MAG: multidrug efflux pump subunit AcrA (membrane-fusion protein) [Verrucomicrobiales bacterium]|jgi:multidrug efflux pump subunit AcrA (membrane-fusion protein)
MKRFYFLTIFSIAAALLLPACNRDKGHGHEHAEPAEEAAGEDPTNRVEIPATVRNNLGITFAGVERRNVETTIRVPGAFELEPLARHEHRVFSPGQVEFAVAELDSVEEGTLLYRFRSPNWLELQSQIELASASLEQAKTQYDAVSERLKSLQTANFKNAELEARAAELKGELTKQEAEMQASLNRAVRLWNFHYPTGAEKMTSADLLAESEKDGRTLPFYQTISSIEVRATKPGFVESLAVTNGTFVEAATLILTTVDPSKVRFRALGLQSDLGKFNEASTVRIVPPQSSSTDINEGIVAHLHLGLSADPIQRTITLFAHPEEVPPWVRPGVSAFLEVASESTGGIVLAIPRSSVVKDGITHVFFKRDPDDRNKAIRVEADLGVDDGRWIEVQSGVGPNDEVVLAGAYELKLATSMSGASQKGGHFHADGTYHIEED